MTARQAARARRIALDTMAYRRWATEPALAVIPSIDVLSNPAIHRRERDRELRRAALGVFSTVAPRIEYVAI